MESNMKDFLDLLGLPVEDKVTKFKGVVTSVSFDVYGCVQCIVQPAVSKDNKPSDSHWFDWKRLTVTSKKHALKPMPFDNMTVGQERGPAAKPAQSSVVR
jgi:hypothetical protein